MTAAERTQQRVIRDLQVRVAELERENARVRAELKRQVALKNHVIELVKKYRVIDEGRFQHGRSIVVREHSKVGRGS